MSIELNYFEDKLGQKVERGDIIAYATRTYDVTRLRVAEVLDMEIRTTMNRLGRAGCKHWIKVKPRNESPRMIKSPRNVVLLTKKAMRFNGQ